MAESNLARRQRLARQHLREDQAFRRKEDRKAHSTLRERVTIGRLKSDSDRLARQERATGRRDLLERIATAKTEALRRIRDLPWYALDKDDWQCELEGVTPTSGSAPQDLAAIAARVKRSRTLADPEGGDPAPTTPASPEPGWGFPLPATVRSVRTLPIASKAQQTQLTVALLLIEIQIDKLIELSREWQSA